MIYQVMSVRDRAAAVFAQPFFVAAIGQAQRLFIDEINRVAENNAMNKHPEDFDLYHLGEYNDENGTFTNLEHAKQILIGKQCKTSV